MGGRAQDDDADGVANSVVEQGLRHVAGFEHVAGSLVAGIVQRLDPLVQGTEVAPVRGGFAAARIRAAGQPGRYDGDAGQARAVARAERTRRRLAQRIQGGVAGVLVGHGDHDDGHFADLLRRQRTGLVVHAGGPDPAREVGAKARALGFAAATGDLHLLRVREVKRQVRRRRVALGGNRLQAAQHYLLQPRRQVRAQAPWRHRIDPQTLAQAGRRMRGAKGQARAAQLVEHDAQGEEVAARVTTHAHDLLRRDPGRRADGLAQLLGQQVWVMGVAGQAKVQQHGAAVGAQQHVGRLQVQVHGVLLVQGMHGARRGRAQTRDVFHGQVGRKRQPVLQGVAGDVLHDQVGQARQVAAGDKAGHVAALQHLHQLALDLVADDGFGAIAGAHARHLHHQIKARPWAARSVHAVNVRHGAAVYAGLDAKAVDLVTGLQAPHRPCSRRCAKYGGKPAARMAAAAPARS